MKIYRVTQPAKKRVSDTISSDPSVQMDATSASIQSEVSETADARMLAASNTMDVSAPSDELGGQNADGGSPILQQSDETLPWRYSTEQYVYSSLVGQNLSDYNIIDPAVKNLVGSYEVRTIDYEVITGPWDDLKN